MKIRKRVAIIGAGLIAMGLQSANAQMNPYEAPFSQVDVEKQSTESVERLDKDVPLDLNENQKNNLVTALVEYNNAQFTLQKEFNQEMNDMEMAFQKTLNDILDEDQRDSFEEYLKEKQREHEEMYEKNVQKAQEEFQKHLDSQKD